MVRDAEHLDYVMDLLSNADSADSCEMIGEYVLHCDGEVYDICFLVKDASVSRRPCTTKRGFGLFSGSLR